MSIFIKKFQYGDETVSLETGVIARQTSGSVVVNINETIVLVTVVGKQEASSGRGFFPLTINYQERTYAAGKIPGGFFKREGRPSERETLIARLIDRPLRPLFPDGFMQEVQIVATVLSLNPEVSPDVPAIIGASAALAISGIPFNGPVGAARVGYVNGEYILNPSSNIIADSELDLVVAGTQHAVLMVESEAKELSEEVMLGAVMFGHQHMQAAISAIAELAQEVSKSSWEWQVPEVDQALHTAVEERCAVAIGEAYQIQEKTERQQRLQTIREDVITALGEAENETKAPLFAVEAIEKAIAKIEKTTVRANVLAGKARIDGRDTKTVRPIHIDVGVLPRAHGSALFTRGETQALVVSTLGTERDMQIVDGLEGESKSPFMLHYNFPPYCVGETGMMGSPKRREIGHGMLAKRGMRAVMPTLADFPYVLRIVSEITESNGSSSMASVCGTSLALMDAGVPIKAPVAGIAMGLIKENDQYAVLTDILGDEDHLGDMDFKVAGTQAGVTALQMDIKIEGITQEIMQRALEQAKAGRLHILDIMQQTIDQPRDTISEFAPRIITLSVHPDKIRDIIGKGGATIRMLTEETGTSIDISDDGIVKIAAVDTDAGEEARRRIELITADVEVDKIYEGKVVKIVDFGAFVNILPGKDGLVHISQISEERIAQVTDVLEEGQLIKVKVLEVDRQGRIRLSMKQLEQETVSSENA